MLSKLTSIIAALMFAAPLLAQNTPPAGATDTPDVAAVKTAAKAFTVALADKDIAIVKKHYAGTDEDFKLVETMHGVFQAGMRLQAAAEKKFPEEMKNQRKSDDFDPKAMAARIDREQVTITDDTAKTSSGMVLKKTGGEWKVVDVIGGPGKPMVIAMFSQITPLFNEAATDIENGKYASFAEAQKGIQEKMMAAQRKQRNVQPPMPAE